MMAGDVHTQGGWLGAQPEPPFGWLSRPAGAAAQSGVLIAPPIGYAWWSSYHTLRQLAERLAAHGHAVLRLQYHGTGNAAGEQSDPDRLAAWRASIARGVAQLRALGCRTLTLVGVGLGGSLALERAAELDVGALALWDPVVSGRREARTLRMRSLAAPDESGDVSFGGSTFSAATLAQLAELDSLDTSTAPRRALIIDGPDDLAAHLARLGARVQCRTTEDGAQALSSPAEDAVAAESVIDAIVGWAGVATVEPGPAGGELRSEIELPWHGTAITERVIAIGDAPLVGVLSSPARGTERPGTVVLLNSGSEPHVGAGRAWVELARALAAGGHRVLRVDFRGWGESPDDGLAPGRPYDPHCLADTEAIIAALEADGSGPVALVGLCAGAWLALHAALRRPVGTVVALNPQLYWEPGDPVEALISDTRRRRAAERMVEEEGRRSGRWDELDRAGERTAAGALLDGLAASPTDVTLLFAEGDDGLEYLHNRLALRLADATTGGSVHVREIPEIDHGMHRAWHRPMMFGAVAAALEGAER